MAVERELRQTEKLEHRERRPGEKERLKKKWIESARRIDRDGKLAGIWNPKKDKDKQESIKGYFRGVNIKNGKIIDK